MPRWPTRGLRSATTRGQSPPPSGRSSSPTKLSREERLSIEGQYRKTAAELDKATEIYRTLFDFFPDNLEYGLRLADVQVSAGKGKDALATLDRLRGLPSPIREDPRIDLAEAAAAGVAGGLPETAGGGGAGVEKGDRAGCRRILRALARIAEGDGYLGLGDPAKAIAAFEDAQRIFTAAGDRGGVASALNRLGNARETRGELAAAGTLLEQALATYREIGNRRAAATTASAVAVVVWRQGRLPEARKLYEEALGVFREIGSRNGEARALNGIANVLREEGNFDRAKAMLRRGAGDRARDRPEELRGHLAEQHRERPRGPGRSGRRAEDERRSAGRSRVRSARRTTSRGS